MSDPTTEDVANLMRRQLTVLAERDAALTTIVQLRAEIERLHAELRNLRTEIPVGVAAVAAIERVRALHRPRWTPLTGDACAADMQHDWPCPTVRALDASTEPAPELERGPDAPTGVAPPDGWGEGLGAPQVIAHDYPAKSAGGEAL